MSVRHYFPGLFVLCIGALLARSMSLVLDFNHLLVAIFIGFVIANIFGVPNYIETGLMTHKLWLATGIVLMGASLTLEVILDVGGIVLLIIIFVAGVTVLIVELLSRNVFGLTERMGSLLAVGAGICGVSAVVAVAGAIRAQENQIAYAAATILLFDAFTIVLYPIVGNILRLSDIVFGIWAGVTMFSTGPVVAVGFAYSEVAGQWATMTKLARNTLIGAIVLIYASYYAQTVNGKRSSIKILWDEFPKFILGFVLLMVVASTGILSSNQQASIENSYNWLFTVAFIGLGSEIKITQLRKSGLKPAVTVLIAFLIASSFSLALLLIVF